MILFHLRLTDLEKAERDFQFLLKRFQEVLTSLGEPDWLAHLLDPSKAALPQELSLERVAQIYSITFQLLNMAEENAGVQDRRPPSRS
jgi:hypothetical protein